SGKKVLEDVNFRVREGEGFGILGKPGSGKTTLIHTLRGTRGFKPTSGDVIFRVCTCECGKIERPSKRGTICERCGGSFEIEEINYWENEGTRLFRELTNRNAIMLQRSFSLYSELMVTGNLEEALREIDYPWSKRKKRIIEMLEKVNMMHRIGYSARDLSGGEKQRIILARQLIKNPIVFFADEPTGTIDPKTGEIVNEALRNEITEGLTMVVASRRMETLLPICDRTMLLEEGQVISIEKTGDIAERFSDEIEEIEKRNLFGENPSIVVENCSKSFYMMGKVVRAVWNVNFTINEGEIFGIIGVSGAGKTTLGRMIGGLIRPSRGRICVKIGDEWVDMTIPGEKGKGKATFYLSMLHEEYALYPHSTILENLTASIGLNLPKEIARKKTSKVLSSVGISDERIEEMLSAYPDTLSENEKHMVALARALMTEPKILILDDPITTKEIMKAILRSREELGQTYLIISHDHRFIQSVCDRVMLFRSGEIVEIGEPKRIVNLFRKIETPLDI
ncbi:MAG: methyl coenzyme M reductase system, component A2, partial [Candidatus Syntropharchaeia archaeon]